MPGKAFLNIPEKVSYRREAFEAGLAACGYEVSHLPFHNAQSGDIIVTWNRMLSYNRQLVEAEGRGARILVTENGFIGKDSQGRQLYSLSLDYHAGFGRWHIGTQDRWSPLGIEVQPYRTAGKHILLCAARGLGSPPVAQPEPRAWLAKTTAELRRHTDRKIVVRMHPQGLDGPQQPPLAEQLRDCWAAVIWCSSSGIEALVRGIPVIYTADRWVAEGAACRIPQVETPNTDPDARMKALHAMAWHQWRVAEISSGEAFRCLL